jgi:hypothetical protein
MKGPENPLRPCRPTRRNPVTGLANAFTANCPQASDLIKMPGMTAWQPCGICPAFAIFPVAERSGKAYLHAPEMGPGTRRRKRRYRGRQVNRKIMDDGIQKSCWGVTAKAVVGFAGILLLAWLIGGPETAAVLAAS